MSRVEAHPLRGERYYDDAAKIHAGQATQAESVETGSGAQRKDVWLGFGIIAVGLMIAMKSFSISNPVGDQVTAGTWPLTVSCIMVFFGTVIVFQGIRVKRRKRRAGEALDYFRTSLSILLASGYLLSWGYVPIMLTTFVFLVSSLYLYRIRKPVPLLVFPAILTILVQVLFVELLRIAL